MKKIIWIAFALIVVHLVAIAQEKLLDRKISVKYTNTTLKEIFTDLSKKYGISVSYSSNQVKLDTRVTINVTDQSLRQGLITILEGTGISFMEYGNQVILKKQEKPEKKSSAVKQVEPAKQVAVKKEETPAPEELKQTSESVLASTQTMFLQQDDIPEITTPEEAEKEFINQEARIYSEYFAANDTAKFQTGKALKKDLKVAVKVLKAEFARIKDSLEIDKRIKRLTRIIADSSGEKKSIRDTTTAEKHRPIQVTFIYPLGTNGVNSKEYTNNVSLNVLAGVNGGVRGAEVASLVNIDKKNVEGFQAAGLVNMAGNNLKGVQASGLVSLAGGKARGGQFSGLVSLAGDTSDVFQASGLVNLVNGSNFGGQFSGLVNATRGAMGGPQGAGLVNYSGDHLKGFQAAGLINVTRQSIEGFQAAGLLNYANTVRGTQVGFINTGRKIEGVQIGFLNISDTISGLPIGFLSFSRKGYTKVELSATEVLYPSLSIKTGTKTFYNILTTGLKPGHDMLWWYGYGVGTLVQLTEKIPLNFDLVVNQVNRTDDTRIRLNLLNQLKVQAGYQFAKHFTVFAGPVVNLQITQLPSDVKLDYNLAPYSISSANVEFKKEDGIYNNQLKWWVGFSGGIRL